MHVLITALRHILFAHDAPALAVRYPRFAKNHETMLLSVEEVHFLRSGGLGCVTDLERPSASSTLHEPLVNGGRTEGDDTPVIKETRPHVTVAFATPALEAAFHHRLQRCRLACDVYCFLSSGLRSSSIGGQGWVLRHAGAMYGADFIGYRLPATTSGDGSGGRAEDTERQVRHGEALFVMEDGVPWTAGETAAALRVARSVGKRLLRVTRAPEALGGFEIAPIV